jgi:ABC-2 type transport system permease protein
MAARISERAMTAVGAMNAIAQVTLKEWAAFRSHMLVSLLTGPLRFLVMAWMWKSTLAGGGKVAGMGRDDLVAYSGLAVIVTYAVFDFADWNLHMLVRTGRYATYLLLPIPHIAFAFSQKLGHRLLAMLLEALPVWLLVSLWLGRPLLPAHPFWFAASVMLGFLLVFLVNYAAGLIGFWMTRTEGLRRCLVLLRDTLGGAYIPLAFFPPALQPILFCLPYAWAMYVPLRIGLGSVVLAGHSLAPPVALALQAAFTAMWALVVAAFHRMALKRYLAAGG